MGDVREEDDCESITLIGARGKRMEADTIIENSKTEKERQEVIYAFSLSPFLRFHFFLIIPPPNSHHKKHRLEHICLPLHH